ncbi:MAG: sensor histidine kinase, partial [Candidatus Fimimonas sp.]
GMSEETQKNMFNKFFQGDKSRATEGNGLGLSVVKKICELLQIRLDVQSALGVGTLFTLTFADTPAVQNYTTVGK